MERKLWNSTQKYLTYTLKDKILYKVKIKKLSELRAHKGFVNGFPHMKAPLKQKSCYAG